MITQDLMHSGTSNLKKSFKSLRWTNFALIFKEKHALICKLHLLATQFDTILVFLNVTRFKIIQFNNS